MKNKRIFEAIKTNALYVLRYSERLNNSITIKAMLTFNCNLIPVYNYIPAFM